MCCSKDRPAIPIRMPRPQTGPIRCSTSGRSSRSMTKFCIARLWGEHKLTLDDTIGKFLPDYPNREAADSVTIRHLQTMTSDIGDFFGPKAGNNWFSQGLIEPGKPVRTIRNPGRTGVGHQWSYLPDVARTMVELLARRDSLQPFATFHMAGHWDADGSQMSESIQRVVAHRSGRAPRISAPRPDGGRAGGARRRPAGCAPRAGDPSARGAWPPRRSRNRGRGPAGACWWAG